MTFHGTFCNEGRLQQPSCRMRMNRRSRLCVSALPTYRNVLVMYCSAGQTEFQVNVQAHCEPPNIMDATQHHVSVQLDPPKLQAGSYCCCPHHHPSCCQPIMLVAATAALAATPHLDGLLLGASCCYCHSASVSSSLLSQSSSYNDD